MLARLRFVLAAACASSVALVPIEAQAVPLIATYGGPAGYGTSSLAPNDDSYSDPIDLTVAFPGGVRFFGGPYTQVWVNNNGNITFSGGVSQYTPTPFPIADRPMIAPYWGDVDTRGVRDANNNMVYWHLQPGRMS